MTIKSSLGTLRILTLSLLMYCIGESAESDALRTWTSADGNFTLKATLVKRNDNNVVLRKEDGKTTQVDISFLSKSDRLYLAKLRKPVSKPKGDPPKVVSPADPTKISVTKLEIDGAQVVTNLQWSKKGKFLFALDKRGVLHKFSVPGCSKIKSVDLEGEGAWLTRSSVGLVASLKSTQEICVVDPDSLKVSHRHKVAGANLVAGEPTTSMVFVTDGSGRNISALDARNGKVLGTQNVAPFHNAPKAWRGIAVRAHPSALGFSQFRMIAAVPGGKMLLAVDRSCIYKFSVSRRGIKIQEVGPHIAANPQRIEVSHDGKFVALPSGGGNNEIDGHPDVGYGTYVYDANNLQQAVFGMTTGAYPMALAFDTATGRIYAQNHDYHLLVIKKGGVKVAEHKFDNSNDRTRHILAHPHGNKLCVLTGNNLYWVEFAEQ